MLRKKPDSVIHSEEEIKGIREAAVAASTVRDRLPGLTRPGMSTKVLDEMAASLIASQGGKSAFLGYRGYPGQICISVNDEVVHGIGRPDKILMDGDVLSLDIGVNLNGFIGDTAITFVLGNVSEEIKNLLSNTKKALNAGINASIPGNYVRDISAAVEKIARKAKLGVVRDYVGHGCGCELHEPPEIPNFVNRERGPKLRPGMVLCIEPMLNLGTHKVFTELDKWTVRTNDGKVSAHFEHMVLVTEKDPEVLTWQKK